MRRTTILFSSIIVAVFLLTAAFTTNRVSTKNKAGDWFFLEDKKVGFGADHDVIHFGNWKDDVRQIKLKVTDGPLKMYSMKIYFDNGSIQNVELRNRFAQGSESRVIDMDGGLRHLTKIEFWYETKGFARGRSRVAVWGKN
ncbi:MAG: hypothetical protein IPQ06_00390 [Chitinophagaceae bacterium]|nr:hypothetical protein [Chitinophagaceae bacterium]MBK9569448.1 hypothetical protein [Chitinophagaceae bacterium]MBL0271548.1 hypothetical protein [Chitinophagaceae bacterium]